MNYSHKRHTVHIYSVIIQLRPIMFSLNNNSITKTDFNTKNLSLRGANGLSLKVVSNQLELSGQYAMICQQYTQIKKWILIINPDESSLEQLANMRGIDTTKILCVSLKNKKSKMSKNIDIEQIKKVLCRGNCSAVIMSNANLSTNEMTALDHYARLGKTQCLLLSKYTYHAAHNSKTIH